MDLQSTFFGVERPLLKLSAYENATRRIGLEEPLFLDIPSHFRSLHEANQHLVVLTNECLRFTGQTTDITKHTIRCQKSNAQRQCLSSYLCKWLKAYSQPHFTVTQLEKEDISWKSQSALMLISHSWLTVVLATSYIEVEEIELDCLISYFSKIVELTAFVYSPVGEGTSANRKHFALELGLLPPLWMTATRCRHPKIRREALWYMGRIGGEGFLDPTIQRQLAVEIVLLEEGAGGQPGNVANLPIISEHDRTFKEDAELAVFIPLQWRIGSGKVTEMNDDTQRLLMEFRRKRRSEEGMWTGEFDLIVVERSLEAVKATRQSTDNSDWHIGARSNPATDGTSLSSIRTLANRIDF